MSRDGDGRGSGSGGGSSPGRAQRPPLHSTSLRLHFLAKTQLGGDFLQLPSWSGVGDPHSTGVRALGHAPRYVQTGQGAERQVEKCSALLPHQDTTHRGTRRVREGPLGTSPRVETPFPNSASSRVPTC